MEIKRYRFMRYPEGRAKAVTLSYDDGIPEDKRFSDIISEYGIKCTFNLNAKILRGDALTDEEIKEYMIGRGHEIAVHGALHRAEGSQRPIEGIKDILDCRLELEERFGIIVRGMAYPDTGINYFANGATYEKIKSYLTDLDIAYSRTLGGDNNSFMLPNDWYAWMPTAHHNNPDLNRYINEFLSLDLSEKAYLAKRAPILFYLWGHSYEFERNNNWEILYEFCEKIANKDDVWYATNMEIYEYVKAYSSLVYSADGNTIYNPSLIKIWFDIDGKLYSICSGETINI